MPISCCVYLVLLTSTNKVPECIISFDSWVAICKLLNCTCGGMFIFSATLRVGERKGGRKDREIEGGKREGRRERG